MPSRARVLWTPKGPTGREPRPVTGPSRRLGTIGAGQWCIMSRALIHRSAPSGTPIALHDPDLTYGINEHASHIAVIEVARKAGIDAAHLLAADERLDGIAERVVRLERRSTRGASILSCFIV